MVMMVPSRSIEKNIEIVVAVRMALLHRLLHALLLLPALVLAQARQCAFDHGGHTKPCCGQPGIGATAADDPHVCPQSLPTCTEYIFEKHWGWCASAASGTAFCDGCLQGVVENTDGTSSPSSPPPVTSCCLFV